MKKYTVTTQINLTVQKGSVVYLMDEQAKIAKPFLTEIKGAIKNAGKSNNEA